MKNIFFDLDGTLVDSLPGIEYAVDSALAGMQVTRTEPLRPLIGPPIRDILKQVAGGVTESELDGLVTSFRAAYDSRGWRKTEAQPGTAEMLESLRKAGMKLFLVTNKPQDASLKILSMLGIRSHFQEVLARDSVKPNFVSKAHMLSWFLHNHGVAAEDSLMVGDTGEDASAAAAVGMKAVIMSHGYGGQETVARCEVLDNFTELTDLVRVGRTPWSARDPQVPLPGPCTIPEEQAKKPIEAGIQ